MADLVQYYGTGRRKSSIARVFLRPGSGSFQINGRAFDNYFVTDAQRVSAKAPLVSSETGTTFDVVATVQGGGVNGQADAVKMGIARALLEFNIELRKKLKAEGLLSRDARGKERKKYGQKGARKRFQFSKR
ncbi:MAG: 30S ribosomal protein S9 [Acidobacteria bacterium]|nr:MAG: 30S ribosomal protein S9 [Acidobacteriota bacterium]PYY22048.1 MAG: 30S ribosomal protein S9 [Acidobacteriota bacterium]